MKPWLLRHPGLGVAVLHDFLSISILILVGKSLSGERRPIGFSVSQDGQTRNAVVPMSKQFTVNQPPQQAGRQHIFQVLLSGAE
jgi:hypothetical protein